MKIAVASNWKDRLGLYTEGKILCEILEGFGHACDALQYDNPLPNPEYRADLLIALETHCPHLMSAAPVKWYVPNIEWMTPDLIPDVGANYQKIICKTREAFDTLRPIFPTQVAYTGFAVKDIYDPKVPRRNNFLHVGGNSGHRNTEAVVDAWRWKQNGERIEAPLIVVSRAYKPTVPLPSGVTHISEFVPEEELRRLQNECFFHLYPSAAEGFGHALREGLICNNMVLGTNRSPLNEIDLQYRVSGTRTRSVGMTQSYAVDAREINLVCRQMLRDTVYRTFRQEILEANAGFAMRIGTLLQEAQAPAAPLPIKTRDRNAPKRVAFLGNFGPFFSTENEIKWTLEREGTIVYPIQENQVRSCGDMLEIAAISDLFLWVRTPDYLQIPNFEMEAFLGLLRDRGVPSASYHLDRFWDIPEREALIGVHPFWRTEFVFTADGGPHDWTGRGVNHYWMPPAVCARGCYPGNVRPEYQVQVAFVGSVDYHSEYPERKKLIEAAREYYGNQFQVFTGVRGQDLNDVYASAKVILGDSMFANQKGGKSDFYFSDRVPETMGRGGVLVHPYVRGLAGNDYAGIVLHDPSNFPQAFETIDDLLGNPEECRRLRNIGMEHIRKNHTYTNRMAAMWNILETGMANR